MADISKIAPNIQSLSSTDEGLLSNFEINFELSDKSCIEFYIYDTNGTILYSNYNYTS